MAAGLIFGFGLLLSGMCDPTKVLGFLDVTGAWDPSLAFVMAGAIAVGLVAFGKAAHRGASYLGAAMPEPLKGGVDLHLLAGSALFGIGWGLAGFCPGPALVGLGMGEVKAVVFVLAMLAGMALFERSK